MTYVALLRGINVGGNNKVAMLQLKATFERLGLDNVRTYINTGNVIFTDTAHTIHQLTELIEHAIETEFGFKVFVLIKDRDAMRAITKALPSHWANNAEMKADVMLLWENVDSPEILSHISITPNVDEVKYIPGALLWRIDRKQFGKSKMNKLVGTKLYKTMTIRNCNTVRKLVSLMQE